MNLRENVDSLTHEQQVELERREASERWLHAHRLWMDRTAELRDNREAILRSLSSRLPTPAWAERVLHRLDAAIEQIGRDTGLLPDGRATRSLGALRGMANVSGRDA